MLRRAVRAIAQLLATATVFASVSAHAADALVSAADVARTLGMLFAGDAGAASGDVNADGRATAADVCGVLQGLRSPTQQGPYGIGFQATVFTKQSVSMPDQQRMLSTTIWYPAAPGTGDLNQRPGGLRNAPLADGATNLPLLMFSHGSCGFEQQSVFLTALIASYGFVVVAPRHPGNSTHEILTCSTPAAVADSFANRPADILFVLDAMLAENDDPSSFFYRAIDPSRIGMSGHSFGGLTTLRVTSMDHRIVGGLALAPSARSIPNEVAAIRVPMMIQVGTLDDLLPDAELAYNLLQPPRQLVEILNMTHSPFSDFCTECGPTTITPDQAHLFILRYAVPWVLHFVADDQRFDAFLGPGVRPPGLQFTVDNDLG